MSVIDNQSINMLGKYLDLTARRQSAVAQNIANLDTPGYRTKDVDFLEEVKQILSGNDLQSPTEINVQGLLERPDGNNVSADRESLLLAQTQLQFRTGVQLLRSQMQRLSIAINEGRAG
jgi:flagellar basal-body rod protein FlgB